MESLLHLKRGKERKILNLYPWVYRDEVRKIEPAGPVADLHSHEGKFVARGLYSRGARIVWRFLSFGRDDIDVRFVSARISEALGLRRGINSSAFRVVFSESDFLGGLVIDRYNDGVVMQVRSRGMEEIKDTVIDAIDSTLKPSFIYERSDMEGRRDEGLEPFKGPVRGEVPERLIITENGVRFYVDVRRGLKTGFYLDQRRSREYVAGIVEEGYEVLDLFSYTGGFSVYAALRGAKVLAVDTKEEVLTLARENAALNGVRIDTLVYDAFKFLEEDGGTYDLIVADPPAISKRKHERRKLLGAVWKLTYNALPHLKVPGHLYICTCSYQAGLDEMVRSVRAAAIARRTPVHVRALNIQPEDHPFLPQFPESLYLKCLHVVKVRLV